MFSRGERAMWIDPDGPDVEVEVVDVRTRAVTITYEERGYGRVTRHVPHASLKRIREAGGE